MKILHRYMLKQFIGPFIVAFFIVVITLLMQSLWKYIDDLVGKGLPVMVIAELNLYAAVWLSNLAFPLAILLASIFALGNMGENYELIALKSAGISLQRILFPLIILAFVISVGAFFFLNDVAPRAFLKWRALIWDIQQQRPELKIQEEMFYNGIDGYSIRIGKRDYNTNMLYDLWIYNHTKKQGNVHVTLADSGTMTMTVDKRFLEVILYHGHSYEDAVEEKRNVRQQNKNYPFRRDFFDRQMIRIALPNYDLERSDVEIFKSGSQMMNLPQLSSMIDSLTKMISGQEDQLRTMVQPAYRNPELKNLPVDTMLRAKVPENFRDVFNKQTKEKRQTAVQEAVNSVRSQKDQVAGLSYEIDNKNRQTRRYQIEWHYKFTISFSCFIFFFIGAPLGAIIRKGGLGTPIIIAVLFFVMYYVLSEIGKKSAREGALSAFEGMWMSTFIILGIGIFLTWMATRDSSIFNQELYVNYIKKGLGFIFTIRRMPRPEIDYPATSTDLAPENMISHLEELSQNCKIYLESDFSRYMKFRNIWYQQEDTDLTKIGRHYDHILAILKQSDIEMIKETVDEYPLAALQNFKIKKEARWQPLTAAVIFPVWFYLYLKVWIQRYSLRNEMQNIMIANRNLVNELNSII
jgi:lipopolysaccharide export system permease protein